MTTLTADAHREALIRAIDAKRHYEVLMLGEPYLSVCPDDDYVRLMSVRAYLTLGLVGPARAELESAREGGSWSHELQALYAQLAAIETPSTSFAELAPQFESNAAALDARGLDTTTLRGAWQARSHRYRLYRDVNAVPQVQRKSDDGRWAWFPSLRHHPQATANEPLPESLKENMPLPVLFDGVGEGGLLERIYDATLDTLVGYSCALLVVEPDAADFAVALHLRNWNHLLADRRMFIFIGDDWLSRLERHWAVELNVPLPVHALSIGPRSQSPERDALVKRIEQAHRDRDAVFRESLERTGEPYRSHTSATRARRFAEVLDGTGPPLRILCATSTHTTFLQHSMRDAERALTSLGCVCRVMKEETHYDILSPAAYHEAIQDFKPDLFFVLDHLRSGFGGTLPKNLPLLTWDQDQLPHVLTSAGVRQIAPHDFVTGYSKARCVELGANPRQFLYSGVPTCPDQFGGAPLTRVEYGRYACDVSYVSHASQTPQAFHEQERQSLKDPRAVQLLDELYDILPQLLKRHHTAHGAVIETALEEGVRRCGIAQLPADLHTRLTSWYLWRLGDRIFRHEALEWAGAWARSTGRTLRIYGNDWEHHPTLREFACGPAGNGRELMCVYRASKINLQLMPAGFIHQRALDGLASGGFFLTRLTPHDLKGRLLRRLVNRIDELGISSGRELLDSTDADLTRLLHELHGDHHGRLEANETHLIQSLRIAAEAQYSDEIFDEFERICFDSQETFRATVETFLADDAERERIATSMRNVVVERLSYRATMKRFLEHIAAYYQEMAP